MSTTELTATLADLINEEHRLVTSAAQSAIEHARAAGRLLIEAKSQCKHGSWDDWLQAHFDGSDRTARGYMRVAKRWPEIEAKRQHAADLSLRDALRLLSPGAHVSQNSGHNEWYTPREYVDAAVATMGGIDLDPASSPEANTVIGATLFYAEQDNGLERPWAGRVWLNPPYAQPLVGQFAEKLVRSIESGDVPQACALTNNASETQFFQSMGRVATAVCFPAGRVKFWHPERESAAPLQGQAVFYFGPNAESFCQRFGQFGICVFPVAERKGAG